MAETTRAKMEKAKALIQVKKYAAARDILVAIDHPTAKQWLAKLDAIDPPPALAPVKRKGRGLWWKIPALMVLCSFVCVVAFLYTANEAGNRLIVERTLTAIHEEYCSGMYRVGSSRWDECMRE